MTLVPTPEPAFAEGRPNVYAIHYPGVNGWYVGKNETGRADYMGSLDRAALKAIEDAHEEVGLPIVRNKHLLWSPPDATVAECRNQEWVWIARFRAHHDGPVFNVFPIEDWSDHFRWEHDPSSHVDRATNSRWPVVYVKLQARCDAEGNCSGGKDNRYDRICGRPWGEQARGVYWCKVLYPDGREEWLQPPSPHGNPYDAFREHKFNMVNSAAPLAADAADRRYGTGSPMNVRLDDEGADAKLTATLQEGAVRLDELAGTISAAAQELTAAREKLAEADAQLESLRALYAEAEHDRHQSNDPSGTAQA